MTQIENRLTVEIGAVFSSHGGFLIRLSATVSNRNAASLPVIGVLIDEVVCFANCLASTDHRLLRRIRLPVFDVSAVGIVSSATRRASAGRHFRRQFCSLVIVVLIAKIAHFANFLANTGQGLRCQILATTLTKTVSVSRQVGVLSDVA